MADAVLALRAAMAPTLYGIDDTWTRQAACRRVALDTRSRVELFYGRGRGRGEGVPMGICAACPVLTRCLGSALAEEARATGGRPSGIRGGVRATDRRRLLDLGRAVGCVEVEHWHVLAERWVDEQVEL